MAEPNSLVGKTIEKAWKEKVKDCDDEPYLFLQMTDGTLFKIKSYYGGFTGNSEDEYPVFIAIEEVKKNG